MGRRRKTDRKRAPSEVERLKRELGLGKQHLRRVPNFVRMQKTSEQIVGPDPANPNISWQSSPRNIGGGADLPNNRFVVPEGRTGLWRIRVALHCDAATVDNGSNYRVSLTRNSEGPEVADFAYASNHTGASRAYTARLEDERFLDEGDMLWVRLKNFNTAGSNVHLIADSHVTFEYMGFVEE